MAGWRKTLGRLPLKPPPDPGLDPPTAHLSSEYFLVPRCKRPRLDTLALAVLMPDPPRDAESAPHPPPAGRVGYQRIHPPMPGLQHAAPPILLDVPQSDPQPSPMDGKLGEYILRDTLLYDSLGWEALVRHRRGKGDIRVDPCLKHPAGPLLAHLGTTGAPCVLSDRPWSKQRLLEAMTRGPHKSALDFTDFLEEEFANFVDCCQWIVLSWSRAKHLKNLRVSPPGVVPQRERRPRLIADLTFWLINMMTVNLSPKEAMQFGRSLDCLIHTIVLENPVYGHVHQMKVDLADGFYRMWLQLRNIPKLALVLPPLAGSTEPLIALPLGLPMGWVEPPPWFCVATKTIADVTNMSLLRPLAMVPPQRLEANANTRPS